MVLTHRYYERKFTFIYSNHKEYANIIRIYLESKTIHEFTNMLDSGSVEYSIE